MDDIKSRLEECTKTCLSCYDAWMKDKKKSDVRETLMESVHELRKVAARLEIEMAISEREQMTKKPIPIPPHRSASKRNIEPILDSDTSGNSQNNDKKNQRQRRSKRSSGGSGGRGKKAAEK